jgi:hypothetical protein
MLSFRPLAVLFDAATAGVAWEFGYTGFALFWGGMAAGVNLYKYALQRMVKADAEIRRRQNRRRGVA